MTKFQKTICWLIVFGVVVGGAGFIVLNRNIDGLQFAISGLSFENQAGQVSYFDEYGLAELMRQQNAPFSNLKQELRGPDAEAFRATLAVTASPKEYKSSSTAQLVCGDQIAPMELSGGVFTGEIIVPLDAGEAEYMVLLETDGTIRSQPATLDLSGFAGGADVFGWDDETATSSSDMWYRLNAALKLDETLLPFVDEAASARIYAQKLEGTELFSKNLEGGVLHLSQEFSEDPGEEITIYGEVQGKSGMIYTYALYRVSFSDYFVDGSRPWENLRIIGAKGQELEVDRSY